MKSSNRSVQVGLAVVLCMTMTLAGCSTNWIGEAEEVVAALQGKTVSAADLQTIQNAGTQAGADLQLIQSLITAYQTADATAKPGILNQIQTAIGAVQASLQGLLPALHIQDPATQAKITAVVGIVLSEVQSLAAIVPLVQNQGTVASGQLSEKTSVARVKVPLTASEFVRAYNATLTAKTGNTALDKAAAGLTIHVHGKAARWATAGVLK